MHPLINMALSQLGWFAIVLSAARNKPWVGIGIAMLLIAVHLMVSKSRSRETVLIVACAGIGLVVDTILISGGAIAFFASASSPLPPLWMTALWMLFGTLLCHSLAWLKNRPLLAATLGLVCGPLAYLSGAKLGALQVRENLRALAMVGLVWSFALTFLTRAARAIGTHRVVVTQPASQP